MNVGDYFKIDMPRKDEIDVIYEAVVVSQGSDWVSAKIVYPAYLAEKLKAEGVFKIHITSLDIVILGNPKIDGTLGAIYG